MALPSSGPISLSQVRTELVASGPANLGSPEIRSLFGVASGTIKLSNGYGKSTAQWFPAGNVLADPSHSQFSVSDDGNTLAIPHRVSTTSNNFYVKIFTRLGSSWVEQATLLGADTVEGDCFGYTTPPAKPFVLSGDGNTLAVCARDDSNSKGTAKGSVYIFTRSEGTWAQTARLEAWDTANGFCTSVALNVNGTVLAVGSYLHDVKGTNAGAVYVYHKGTSWAGKALLYASDAAAEDRFGSAVDLNADGTVLAVGAPLNDPRGTNRGSAYIYTYNGTAWVAYANVLSDANSSGEAKFGSSLSLNAVGDTLAVGAYFDGASSVGCCCVFVKSGNDWVLQQRIIRPDVTGGDWFGYYVHLSADGNTLIASSMRDEPGEPASQTEEGSVCVYTRNGTTWQQVQHITSPAPIKHGQFGMCALIRGNTIFVSQYQSYQSSVRFYMFERAS